jgi:hypothetical protein
MGLPSTHDPEALEGLDVDGYLAVTDQPVSRFPRIDAGYPRGEGDSIDEGMYKRGRCVEVVFSLAPPEVLFAVHHHHTSSTSSPNRLSGLQTSLPPPTKPKPPDTKMKSFALAAFGLLASFQLGFVPSPKPNTNTRH